MLDLRIIDDTQNAELTLGTAKKDPRNPLFTEDRPWEPRYDNVYANVIYDGQERLYKCWYSPFIIDERTTSTPEEETTDDSRRRCPRTASVRIRSRQPEPPGEEPPGSNRI
ncbi:MAG: hypothetical protein ACYSWU_02330 [Planctomycetota bacterium]